MTTITLVYFERCPEAQKVKEVLREAGVRDLKIVLQDKLSNNDPLRKLSSPSVLHGVEILYGVRTNGEIASCSFAQENSLAQLSEQMKKLLETKKF